MKRSLFSILCIPVFFFGALKAQERSSGKVGVNTKTPIVTLDVNGTMRLGYEEKESSLSDTEVAGMVRWNETKKCFEGHNGKGWFCYQYQNALKHRERLVDLQWGDGDHDYADEAII